MGIFKGIKAKDGNGNGNEFTLRESGTYEFGLVEIQAGMVNSMYADAPVPALRFIFGDEEGKLSSLVNIPAVVSLPGGGYGLQYNKKGKFWAVVGALWGKVMGPDDAELLDMDIPGVNSPEELRGLPTFFVEGQTPITGVKIRVGEEDISAAGRAVLLTLSKKQGRDREVNIVTGYAPVPKKRIVWQDYGSSRGKRG